MTGAEMITAERQRQIDEEGWTAEHDAEHYDHSLTRAAVCYALPPGLRDRSMGPASPVTMREWLWPWDDTFKAGDRVRELTKAGALIAAEIDRLLVQPAESP